MNAKQESILRMSGGVFGYCTENADIIAENPAFVTALGEAKSQVLAIKATDAKKINLTGITMDKNDAKDIMIERTADLSALMSAYAATIGNHALDTEISYSESALRKMREDSLGIRCQAIHDKGVELKDELAEYGVTNAILTGAQSAIDDYNETLSKPRIAAGKSKTATADLVDEFKELMAIFTNRLDKLVLSFKTAHPEFVETYENLRKIPDPPTTTTQLKGTITRQSDGAPVAGATITAAATPETAADLSTAASGDPVTTKTGADGRYIYKPLPFGEYKITVNAEGFNEFKIEAFDVKLGDVNHLDAALKQQG